jgi:hypothetical protein
VGYGLKGLGKFTDFSIVAWCINDNLEPLTLVDWFQSRKTSKRQLYLIKAAKNNVALCSTLSQVMKISTYKVNKRHGHEQ